MELDEWKCFYIYKFGLKSTLSRKFSGTYIKLPHLILCLPEVSQIVCFKGAFIMLLKSDFDHFSNQIVTA